MKIAISFLSIIFALQTFAANPNLESPSLALLGKPENVVGTLNGQFSTNAIADDKSSEKLRPVARLFFENTCDEEVHIYLSYLDTNGQWDGDGPYVIQPGRKAYVADTINRIFYFGGFTPVGPYLWKGDSRVKMNDGSVLMLIESRMTLEGAGDWNTRLICN